MMIAIMQFAIELREPIPLGAHRLVARYRVYTFGVASGCAPRSRRATCGRIIVGAAPRWATCPPPSRLAPHIKDPWLRTVSELEPCATTCTQRNHGSIVYSVYRIGVLILIALKLHCIDHPLVDINRQRISCLVRHGYCTYIGWDVFVYTQL